jgi:hypothetical protein
MKKWRVALIGVFGFATVLFLVGFVVRELIC